MKADLTDQGSGWNIYSTWPVGSRTKRTLQLVFLVTLCSCGIYYISAVSYISHYSVQHGSGLYWRLVNRIFKDNTVVNVSVVLCGGRVSQAMVLLKSVALLTRVPVHAHIFGDDKVRRDVKKQLNAWPEVVRRKFNYTLYPIQYPGNRTFHQDGGRFLCTFQRLFLANIMKQVDSVIHLDTDTLVLQPLDDLWRILSSFNSTQIAGLAGESEEATPGSWYITMARQPYVKPYGLNAGVILMNLTRMRQVNFESSILDYYQRYKQQITLGDQDLLNLYFNFSSERLFRLPCTWNYRPFHCWNNTIYCKSAVQHGVALAHGNCFTFHNGKKPMFSAIHKAFEMHQFNESLKIDLLPRIRKLVQESPHSQCKNLSHIFSKQLETLVEGHW